MNPDRGGKLAPLLTKEASNRYIFDRSIAGVVVAPNLHPQAPERSPRPKIPVREVAQANLQKRQASSAKTGFVIDRIATVVVHAIDAL